VSTPLVHPGDRASRSVEVSPHDFLEGGGFDALFRACAADVHGYVFSLLGDRSSAEDVTALAFERLYRSRARLDHARGTPRAWLFAIARNAALDELRRRRRQPRPRPDADPAGEHDAGQEIEQAERRATVRAALATLTPREREVVLLKFHGQLSNGELARVLGVSESNAGTRVHRALTRLRNSCADLGQKEVA
jgi:RNA polymerase sigma-70 factor (ECF subfamily)